MRPFFTSHINYLRDGRIIKLCATAAGFVIRCSFSVACKARPKLDATVQYPFG